MRLIFFLDTQLDSRSAKVVHALQMCDAYARFVDSVELCLPLGNIVLEDAVSYVEEELGRSVKFRIRPMPFRRFGGRFKMVSGWLGTRKVMRGLNVDLAVTLSPLILGELVRRGFASVYEAHNKFINRNSILDRFLTYILIRACRKPEMKTFVAISNPLLKIWEEKGVPGCKIIRQHDGVDESWAKGDLADGTEIRKSWAVSEGSKVVLYAGSLYPDRGIERVMRLADDFPEATFVVIGGPVERADNLRDKLASESLNNIIIRDRVSHHQVRQTMAAADILLMIWSSSVPTIDVCSPMKLFEYMSSGKLIVGDGYPTIHEVLTHGTHALLAKPDCYEDLRMQLAQSLSMSRGNELGTAARLLAAEKYSWPLRAQSILRISKTII